MESTVIDVAVAVIAAPTSVDLFCKPRLTILSKRLTEALAACAAIDELSTPLVTPVKVVAVLPVYEIISSPIFIFQGQL